MRRDGRPGEREGIAERGGKNAIKQDRLKSNEGRPNSILCVIEFTGKRVP